MRGGSIVGSARPIAFAAALVLGAGLAAVPQGAEAAAGTLDLYVATSGSGSTCTQQAPCATAQAAVDRAASSAGAGKHVIVHIASGNYPATPDGVLIDAGTPRSLTLQGEGPSRPRLQLSEGLVSAPLVSNAQTAVTILDVRFPVTLVRLSMTGTAKPGNNAFGVVRATDPTGDVAALAIRESTIHDLTGGADDSGGAAAVGVLLAGRTRATIAHSTIRRIRSGAGTFPGASGGELYFVLSVADQNLRVSDSVLAEGRGGTPGPEGGSGGTAVGIGHLSALAATEQTPRTTIERTTISDLTGADGSDGEAPPSFVGLDDGGDGGATVGVYTTTNTRMHASTVMNIRGGAGGAGADWNTAAFVGDGGVGGLANGVRVVDSPATPATKAVTSSFTDSTIHGLVSGEPGRGGNGTGVPGGAGGAVGGVIGLLAAAGPGSAGVNATLAHVTISGIPAVPSPGQGGTGTAPGSDGTPGLNTAVAAYDANATTSGVASIRLAASLISTHHSIPNCRTVTPADVITDVGYNVFSDQTCAPAPTSQVIPNIAAALSAAADNGGPTPTVALDPDSPAATAVAASASLPGTSEGYCGGFFSGDGLFATDQRGAIRPGIGAPNRCAAGAYEPQPAACGAVVRRPTCFR